MQIELDIANHTQYATAYSDGKPVATLARRRVYSKGPNWTCYATDGALLFKSYMPTSVEYLSRRIANALQARAPRGWAVAETSVEG